MKVWLLFFQAYEYEDPIIEGVYASEKLAEEERTEHWCKDMSRFTIEEWTVRS